MSHDYVDTRVTAYAFGELSAERAAEFERELSQSSQLRAELAEIREAIAALESEFQSESSDVGDSHRDEIHRAIAGRSEAHQATPPPPPITRELSSERAYRRAMMIASLAACVLVVVGLIIPYLRDRGRQEIALNEDQPAAETLESEELLVLVKQFNDALEQERYSDAEDFADQASKLQPEAPITRTMKLSAQRAQRSLQESTDPSASPTVQSPMILPEMTLEQDELVEAQANLDKETEVFEEFSLDSEELAMQPPPALDGGAVSGEEAMMGMALDTADIDMEMGMSMGIYEEGGGMPSPGAMAGGSGLGGGRAVRGSRAPRRPNRAEMSMGGMGGMDGMMADDMEMMMGGMMGGGMDAMMMDDMDMEMGFGMAADDSVALAAPGHRIVDGHMLGRGVVPERYTGDRFAQINDNPFYQVAQAPLSTFSVDVDTASYAKIRSFLNQNSLPPADAVRIEELVNYFDYDYAAPNDEHPFAASMEVADCPWNPRHRLARIGIQGKVLQQDRPSSNLVFLLDVSGSMDEPNKLPLVIDGMKMLTDQLTENDRVAIVVYAGAAGTVLDSTRGDKKQIITAALDRLKAGGSTNGGDGILLAYQIARDNFIVGGTNRVILCSDGDFNVGLTGTDELVELAKEQARSNIFLSVLGFGFGNHNDQMMEQVSNQANGNYAFVDSRNEARKVLVEEIGSTLVTIAKDVKIQVEFNPRKVAEYRLIGYENRVMAAADFDNDKKDAGEIGAGHTVTALYELVPRDPEAADDPLADPAELRYQQPARLSEQAASDELLILKLRYKHPEGDTSTLVEFPIADSGKRFNQADRDFRFAAAVAGFGMLLRDSPHKGNATMSRISEIAIEAAKGDDYGYRTEFVELIKKARQLRGD